jgi:hypothetical protein
MPGTEIFAGEYGQVFSAAGVVKNRVGRLIRVIVVVAGSAGVLTIYDNSAAASGPILFTSPGTDAIGTIYSPDTPANTGIWVVPGTGQQVRLVWS